MSYGIYTRDLKGCALTDKRTVEEAKAYCNGDHVVCSEKTKCSGWFIGFDFHRWDRLHFSGRFGLELGFVTIRWHLSKYLWADKIVYDPKEGKEGN